jgi:hypothetical protein
MNVIGLSERHESNLRKLASHLLALPEDYGGFHMMNYETCGPCGTAACAIGHGPSCGFVKSEGETWDRYCQRLFGVGREGECVFYFWCFASNWASVDNTPEGAAKRILWLLERGLPEDAYQQRHGISPLCYENWEPQPEIPVVILTKEYECEGVRRPRAKQPCA